MQSANILATAELIWRYLEIRLERDMSEQISYTKVSRLKLNKRLSCVARYVSDWQLGRRVRKILR